MKAVQKLEVVSGLLTLVSSLIVFVIFESVEIRLKTEKFEPIVGIIIVGVVYDILPALLMAVGVLVHVFRENRVGFVMVLVCGAVTFFSKFFLLWLINSFYDYGQLANNVVAASCILTVLTLLFALLSQRSTRRLAR